MQRVQMCAMLGCLAAGLMAAGCGGPALSRQDQVRHLESRCRHLAEKLRTAETRIAELEAAGVRPQPAPKRPEDPYRAVAVRFGRFTGLLGAGGTAETERLKVVIEPIDAEGDVVKRAGRLDLEAFESDETEGAPPRPFCRWTFSADELAQTWLSGLGLYGYVLKLPWPNGRRPDAKRVLLRAALTTIEGDVLTTETTVPLDRHNVLPQ